MSLSLNYISQPEKASENRPELRRACDFCWEERKRSSKSIYSALAPADTHPQDAVPFECPYEDAAPVDAPHEVEVPDIMDQPVAAAPADDDGDNGDDPQPIVAQPR
ncbi:hypothetical protein AVEN_57940-1, partial [Araneus ventricosus]